MQKLELTWIGKEKEPAVEPRILIHDVSKDYGDPATKNMLIHGDNLLALKALEQEFAGQVKCIYIDPPYNTGSAFEHYNDNLEHSTWLSLMMPRLQILRNLLSDDGSIWLNLDDNEAHYCKVLCDEIFGRNNFIGNVIWEKADSPRMDASFFSARHDFILVYAKNVSNLHFNREKDDRVPNHYNKIDENGRRYYLKPMRVMGGNVSESLFFPMIAPDGTEVLPYETDGRKSCWRWSQRKISEESKRVEWVNGRKGWNPYFRIYADTRRGMPAQTIWSHQDAGSNRTSKNESNILFGANVFGTPKPEKLIQKLLNIGSNEGDLILDSFLGSGTTAAVAHKMGRRYIGVELGDHCYSHCLPRLQKVVDGEQGGISKIVNWKGGGGFKFYELAPTLIVKDENGFEIISDQYDATMLAAAVTKLCGYRYVTSDGNPYIHGVNNVGGFIFVTTQYITAPLLGEIAKHFSETQSLVICASAFQLGIKNNFPNIKLRKIPQSVLSKCEYGADNYNLNVVEFPNFDETEEDFEDAE